MSGVSSVIWIEKYRPSALSGVHGQKQVTERLTEFVKRGMPHMLFAGPPGTGKTTAALAMARELYGASWKSNFLELNASDERGIDVVRNKIKDFAKSRPLGTAYKIVCLDEADSLTADAQHALRRTMERYSETTRFILICNWSNKIIDAIQSRCAVFRFRPLGAYDARDVLERIADEEGLDITKDAIDAVIELADGDMRKSINVLQMASTLPKITAQSIYDSAAAAQPKIVKGVISKAMSGKFSEARDALMQMLRDGIAGEDFLKEASKQVPALSIDDRKKAAVMEKLGEYEYRIAQGGDPQIQIEAFLAQLSVL